MRRLAIASFCFVVLASGVAVMAIYRVGVGREQVVRAHRFVLTDAAGRERATIAVEEAGAATLSMADAGGTPRAPERSLLRIADRSGQARIGLGLAADDPAIVVFDENGTPMRRFP